MFDLITGQAVHAPHRPAVPILVSIALHAMALTALVIIPLLYVTDQLPQVPDMMAFITAPLAPPPPPPAPAPRTPSTIVAKPVPTSGHFAAPVEAPARIEAEPISSGVGEGVPGGVESGVPGGVIGGIVAGVSEPPPPPPPPAPRAPVRIGGELQAPRLLRRVEPDYPAIASMAAIQGVVILETVVNEKGMVEGVTVLRSAHPVLDHAAIAAVKQWQYSPLLLDGVPAPFILTVVLSFHLT